ncbi:MAG: GntR family transcriptional regulator [Rhizobiaceae bacterium]
MKLNSWHHVHEDIQQRILDRRLLPGQKLPKDDILAKQYGCARTTVQRAMRELAESGAVDRRRKGGTRITQNPVTRAQVEIPITRLDIEERGCSHGYQLVSSEIERLPFEIASRFELLEQQDMLNVRALHFADKRPYIFEDRWISTQTVPEILDVNFGVENANEWLIRNRPYSRCDIRIFAIKANDEEAQLLQTEPAEALLVIERTTWIENRPITSVRAVHAPNYQLVTSA